MATVMTTTQVARRLGVKPQTVYAYVSRGLLSRGKGPDGRGSQFDSTEVERLARRGRPRAELPRRGGIEVVLATSITQLGPTSLRYRGREATDLARQGSFEEVINWLWEAPPGTADAHTSTVVLEAVAHVTAALPTTAGTVDRLAAATVASGATLPLKVDLRPATVQRHARLLIAALIEALPPLTPGLAPARRSTIAHRLWPRLSSQPATKSRVGVLDAALCLLADHELAASTLAVRVAASTRADPFAAVLAGLGALSGPLHGGAAVQTRQLVREALAPGAVGTIVARHVRASGVVAGFGHQVYTGPDPRAVCLLGRARPLLGRRTALRIDELIAVVHEATGLDPNVDFALAVLAETAEMGADATTAVFAVARTVGWIAHALEEYGQTPLRFRPRAVYTGAEPPAGPTHAAGTGSDALSG
jgi:citrate synthase